MKKSLLLTTTLCTLFLTAATAIFANNQAFQKYANQILKMNAKPKTHIETTTFLIMHPMIKQRETKLVHYARLSWQGNKCTKKITRFQKIKGHRVRGNTGVGRSYNFYYISKKLRAFCTKAKITDWQKKQGLRADGKTYHGYKFKAIINGVKKNCAIYLTRNNKIKIVVLGFNSAGISHARNMRENGTFWYFSHTSRGLRLTKIIRLTAQKKRGIPILKKSVQKFSNF